MIQLLEFGKGLRKASFAYSKGILALVVASTCSISAVLAQQSVTSVTSVSGHIYQGDTVKQALQDQAKQLKSNMPQLATTVVLEPITAAELVPVTEQTASKKVMVGVGRVLPPPYDDYVDQTALSKELLADGGEVTTLAVTSPDAAALRLQLLFSEFPKGVELRFYAPTNPAAAIGPITHYDVMRHLSDLRLAGEIDGEDLAAAPYWSPLIEGDTIAVEIYTPAGIAADDLQFSIPILSHLAVAPTQDDAVKRIQDIGSSGSCNIDVACVSDLPPVIRESVAKYVFTTSSGFTSLCTGTLLNDTDTNTTIPYFLTANHCLSSQSEASSMEFFWFFQLQTCGVPNSGTISQQSGGATLRSTGRTNDHTFVELRQSPPQGVAFAGWSTNAVTSGATVIGIHHPQGDLKKFSLGRTNGFEPFNTDGINVPSAIEVIWSDGTTEPGSSGSGLFLQQGSDFFLIGTLSGGFASCSFLDGPDFYGRFDQVFPLIQSFLAPGSGGGGGSSSSRLLNISTNAFVDSGGMQAGFVVTGSGSKRFGIIAEDALGSNGLSDPVLEVVSFNPATGEQQLLASNDDWQNHPTATEVTAALRAPNTLNSAALAVTLPGGNSAFLARVSGFQGTIGRAVISVQEIQNSAAPRLLNISTNAFVDSGGMQAGFVVTGSGSKRFGIIAEDALGSNGLSDPVLEVVSFNPATGEQQLLASNDDWQNHPTATEVTAALRAPNTLNSAALAVTLPGGNSAFLARVSGFQGTIGRAVISIQEIGD